MLRTMILIREFDERAIQLRLAGKIYGAVHPYVGQEAVAVGVCACLSVTDRVTSTHRGHGHCIAKGADVRRMMAELFGRVDGYCKGKGGSMHIADFAVGMLGANGIVGGGLPIACGAALAGQLEGKGAVTVCFFGDGAAAEGEFHESLNIASWKAGDPVARLEQHLVGRAMLSPDELRAIRDGVAADLDDAVAFADASPFPDPKDLMADMFAP